MEAVRPTRRIGAGSCFGVVLAAGLAFLWFQGATPPVSSAPRPALPPAPRLDLDRLYDLDTLVVEGSGPRLELGLELGFTATLRPAPVRAGAVPEPSAGPLVILGFAALYTLYLPARSW